MKIGKMFAVAKSKAVVQNAGLRTLGTTIIGAGLLAYQSSATLEEKGLAVAVMLIGFGVYIAKDMLKAAE